MTGYRLRTCDNCGLKDVTVYHRYIGDGCWTWDCERCINAGEKPMGNLKDMKSSTNLILGRANHDLWSVDRIQFYRNDIVNINEEDWDDPNLTYVRVYKVGHTLDQCWHYLKDKFTRVDALHRPIQERVENLAKGIREEPDERCNICGVKAPKKMVSCSSPGNILGNDARLTPDLTGWSVTVQPYQDFRHQVSMPGFLTWCRQFKEARKHCPDCAKKVRDIEAHLTTPYVDGIDD